MKAYDIIALAGLLLAVTSVTAFLEFLGQRQGRLRPWHVVSVLTALAFSLAIGFDDPRSETSYFAVAVACALAFIVSASMLTLLRARLRRMPSIALASLGAFVCLMPGYFGGCALADLFPVGRCFF